MSRLTNRAAIAAALLAAACVPALPSWAGPVKANQPAPAFAGRTLDGKPFRLADLRGKVVLLDFWAVDCPPCRLEMPALQQIQRKYAARGLTVVGVVEMNPTAAQARAARRKLGVTYPTVLDPGEKIGKKYGLEAHPTTLLIDRTGRVVKAETGYLRGDEKAFEKALQPLLGAPPAKAARQVKR